MVAISARASVRCLIVASIFSHTVAFHSFGHTPLLGQRTNGAFLRGRWLPHSSRDSRTCFKADHRKICMSESGGRSKTSSLPGEKHMLSVPPIRPDDLPESSVYLFDEETSTHVYLVGTFHLSRVSAKEVRDIIQRAKPAAIMIELCPSRYVNMLLEARDKDIDSTIADNLKGRPSLPMGKLTASKAADNVGRFLSGTYSFLRGFGVESGSEFTAAAEEARTLGSALVLGDRDAFSTLDQMTSLGDVKQLLDPQRIVGGMRGFADTLLPAEGGKLNLLKLFSQPARFLGFLPIAAAISAALAAAAWVAWRVEGVAGVAEESHRAVDDVVFSIPLFLMLALLPRLYHVVIGSRDVHLLRSLLECCSISPASSSGTAAEGGRREDVVVGVVGLLHVNGMLRRYAGGQRPGAVPQAVWVSADGERFVPPPGFAWRESDGSSFSVVRAAE